MPRQRRRDFLRQSGKGLISLAAGAMLLGKPERAVSANERIRFGAIGLGGRGSALVRGFTLEKDVQFVSLCDPDGRRGGDLIDALKSEHNSALTRVDDFRRILENKDIDAVIVATPDHWHALPTIMACQAGKDVYVEKPASHNIWGGRKMVEAARKYNRIVQVGTQTRSAPYALKALEYIQSGALGTIPLCKVYNLKSGDPFKKAPVSEPPKDVNWDLWLGAAPMQPYRDSTMKGGWLYSWDFCGGDMGNDGIHQLDLARMLIGKEYPNAVYCTGGNLAYQDDREVPDTQAATFDYDNMIMTFEMTNYPPYMAKTTVDFRNTDQYPYWPQNSTRIELYGTKQLMIFGRHGDGWQVFTNDGKIAAQDNGPFPDGAHRENFLQCIRSRQLPNADIEKGHRSAILAHLGNIAYRAGKKKLLFDGKTESFLGDESANRLLKRDYRKPYEIPEQI